jgi:ubiquitin-conjugating enzyme E2 Q
MAVSLPDDNDVTRWRVSLTDFTASAPELAADLRAYASATGRPEAIELELRFDGVKFPFTPPFVRVVRPTFEFRTGHVTIGGSICTELLTTKGWSPAYSIENVLTSIRADLVDGDARLNLQRPNAEYSETGARSAFIRVARDHGWET